MLLCLLLSILATTILPHATAATCYRQLLPLLSALLPIVTPPLILLLPHYGYRLVPTSLVPFLPSPTTLQLTSYCFALCTVCFPLCCLSLLPLLLIASLHAISVVVITLIRSLFYSLLSLLATASLDRCAFRYYLPLLPLLLCSRFHPQQLCH